MNVIPSVDWEALTTSDGDTMDRKACCFDFRLLWPCIMNVGWRERKTNKMKLIWCLLSNIYLNMFRALLRPSSEEQECALPLLLQCRTPYAAVHTLVLLMMGIMMPETCWDKSLIINIVLVASCWFLSLHPIPWWRHSALNFFLNIILIL